jgi:hypothetical protein
MKPHLQHCSGSKQQYQNQRREQAFNMNLTALFKASVFEMMPDGYGS